MLRDRLVSFSKKLFLFPVFIFSLAFVFNFQIFCMENHKGISNPFSSSNSSWRTQMLRAKSSDRLRLPAVVSSPLDGSSYFIFHSSRFHNSPFFIFIFIINCDSLSRDRASRVCSSHLAGQFVFSSWYK